MQSIEQFMGSVAGDFAYALPISQAGWDEWETAARLKNAVE
jgi:hypothetical protein